jgi:hypothetical protein
MMKMGSSMRISSSLRQVHTYPRLVGLAPSPRILKLVEDSGIEQMLKMKWPGNVRLKWVVKT